MRTITVEKNAATLIGFAIKARQCVRGFEAVRRAVEKNKVAIVLVNNQISQNSLRKVSHFLLRQNVPVIQTSGKTNWDDLWGVRGQKIIGIKKGNIGNTIIQKFKSGV